MLIDAIAAEGVVGKTLLDIGGGVGMIQHELLKAGAGEATSVDGSSAFIDAAKEEAQRQGHADRLRQHHGDFVDLAPEIGSADIVTLDRVICCYHDVERLVALSSERATRLYGLVYPRENWAVKAGLRLFNLVLSLRRSPFRVFVHPTATVDAVVRRSGLRRRVYRKTLIWQVVVYAR
jgi:magnesium-protoporphyrin O-methyltransferase